MAATEPTCNKTGVGMIFFRREGGSSSQVQVEMASKV